MGASSKQMAHGSGGGREEGERIGMALEVHDVEGADDGSDAVGSGRIEGPFGVSMGELDSDV